MQTHKPLLKLATLPRGAMLGGILVSLWVWTRCAQHDALPEPLANCSNHRDSAELCAACHARVTAKFATAPHGQTLRRAETIEHLGLMTDFKQQHPWGTAGVRLFNVGPIVLADAPGAGIEEFSIQWLFGSGKHAHTPVSVWLNADGEVESLEHRLSWYPDHGWGETLGLAQDLASGGREAPGVSESAEFRKEPGGLRPPFAKTEFNRRHGNRHFGLESLGKIHDPAATRECFGCHTTYLPLKDGGRDFDWARIVPGVSCARCHVHGDRHARAMEDGSEATLLERWAELSPLESVNRCGECHRRADHFTPDELVPENDRLIRFASVGLVQSKCFLRQREWPFDGPMPAAAGARRLDCITCHDPHRPAESDSKFYIQRCATCHDAGSGSYAPACSTQPKESNCLPCHMPKVEVQTPLKFTDHWIRRRGSL